MKDYYTSAKNAEFELVEKRSRFLAHCCPVSDLQEAENGITLFRKEYWDARHNCYAFRLPGRERSSDDGEPSGTAGVPILNVLKSNDVLNTLIVVTRYFGGVLLGTGGLTRAYSKAAAEALKKSGILWMRSCIEMRTEIAYSDYGLLERYLRDRGIKNEATFLDTVRIVCYVPESEADTVAGDITESTEGRCRLMPGDRSFIAYPAESIRLCTEEQDGL